MSTPSSSLSRAVFVASALWGASSLASSNYPGAVSSHLGGDAPIPSCTVCHASNAGGFGTVTKVHGIALMDAGLVAGDLATVGTSLDALAAAGTDSDGGGVSDVDELTAGSDPNAADDDDGGGGVGFDGGPEPLQYGFCAAMPDQGNGLGLAVVLGLVPVLVLRRRRR